MKKLTFIIIFLNTLWGADSETIYLSYGCANCHGFFGEGTSSAPRLQNQREDVLLKRLLNLKKGVIRKYNGTIMISFAKSLDKNQTREMAHYLSIIKTSYENQEYIDYDDLADGDS